MGTVRRAGEHDPRAAIALVDPQIVNSGDDSQEDEARVVGADVAAKEAGVDGGGVCITIRQSSDRVRCQRMRVINASNARFGDDGTGGNFDPKGVSAIDRLERRSASNTESTFDTLSTRENHGCKT